MEFDFRRVRLGERIAGLCAILLFFDMFLHWYGIKVGLPSTQGSVLDGVPGGQSGPTIGVSAWRIFSYTDLLLLLLIVGALGMVFLAATQRSVALPVGANVLVALLGALMTVIVLYRLVNQPGPNDLVTVKLFGYVGLLLTAGVAAGSFQSMRDEGMTVGDAAQRLQDATATTRVTKPAPPAPPPTGAPPAGAPPAGVSPQGDAPPPSAPPAPGDAPPPGGAPPPPGGAPPSAPPRSTPPPAS